jgi:hypothetical protein
MTNDKFIMQSGKTEHGILLGTLAAWRYHIWLL